MKVMKFSPSVLSLTLESRAGLWKAREMSSSIKEMFLPPKAVACDDVGRFRKLKTLVLSCAFNDKFAAQNNAMSVMGHFRDIVYLFLCQR
jgi:hypothetical protein